MVYKLNLSAALIAAILLGGSLFVAPAQVRAIGQLVAPVVHEDILRGQIVEDTLTLINSESESVDYELAAAGEIKDWTAFYKKEDLENPITIIKIPAASYLDAIVKFSVPGDIPNGTYEGYLNLMSLPPAAANSGSRAVLRQTVSRRVSIAVSDKEIVKIESYILPVSYTVKSGAPLKIAVKYDNQGNIAVKPDVQVAISRDNVQLFNAIFPYPEGEAAVEPLSMRTMPAIEWSTAGNRDGKYKARVKIILNGKTIKESDFDFNVSGNLEITMASLINTLGKTPWVWFAVLAFIVAGFLGGALFFKFGMAKGQNLPN